MNRKEEKKGEIEDNEKEKRVKRKRGAGKESN